ncbi:porin family protein [Aquabacterium sp.]|uniref:porin family protein n=1 Tax=Aquabacterium sp. TaxID=1872578 RepID=UPI002E36062E|nr:porin family protein [Aquabacterium sp.]HEX5311987.1 porin family protein [Aquabacterium sp.]
MKFILISTAVALASVSAHAQQKPNFYVEAGYTFVNYEENIDGDIYKSSPKAIRLIGGAELSKNVALEAMVGFNGGNDSVTANGVNYPTVKFKMDSMYGVFVKPKVELAPNFELFGRLGYTHATATVSEPDYGSFEASDSDFSYGVGITYRIDPKLSISADYMSYLNKTDYSAKGFTIGLGLQF